MNYRILVTIVACAAGMCYRCYGQTQPSTAANQPSTIAGCRLTPGVRTLCYVSDVDNSPQSYVLYLPKAFSQQSAARYPVVFFGVGYGGSASPPPCQDWADENGWIFVSFDGRKTLHYNGVAEKDLDQLLHRELAGHLPIDLARVFFVGASQGASGAFGIGFRRPDWFAGVAGSGGFVDVDEWYPHWNGEPSAKGPPPRAYNGPAWRLRASLSYSAVHHAENAYWLNPYIHVGERDYVNCQWALRKLSENLSKLGITHVFVETLHGGHTKGFVYRDALEHFRTRCTPIDPDRPRAWISANRLEHATMGWASIDAFFGRDQIAKLQGDLEPNAIRVTTNSLVRAFTLRLRPQMLEKSKIAKDQELGIQVDGVEVHKLKLTEPASVSFVRSSPRAKWESGALPAGLRKTAAVEGPANCIFETPFVVAYGASGSEAQTAANLRAAQQLGRLYKRMQKAEMAILSDTDCGEQILKDKSVLLIGDEQTNKLVAQCAKLHGESWPYVADGAKIGLKSGKVYSQGDHSLYGIFPSPWNGSRCVVLATGFADNWPLGLGWRAPTWLGDYTIFRNTPSEKPESSNTEPIVESGFFDEQWRQADSPTPQVYSLRPPP